MLKSIWQRNCRNEKLHISDPDVYLNGGALKIAVSIASLRGAYMHWVSGLVDRFPDLSFISGFLWVISERGEAYEGRSENSKRG